MNRAFSLLAEISLLLRVRDETKRLITGCLIVLAVILDQYRHRFANRQR